MVLYTGYMVNFMVGNQGIMVNQLGAVRNQGLATIKSRFGKTTATTSTWVTLPGTPERWQL